MIRLMTSFEISATGMKDTYTHVLTELADQDERVVYLDADLANPCGMLTTYGKAHPDRFIDCGIMEANMIGTATGLSAAGMIPFAHSFSCFIARKGLDSIFLTGGFAQQNVKLIGSDPGVTAEQNGASHAGMEDFGILKNIPGITLVDPCDPAEFEAVLRQSKEQYGMFYIRYNRKAVPQIYDSSSTFELGKGNILKDGTDVTLISSGIMVYEALKAADMLALQGISARVVDLFTWKPLDEDLICRCAGETGAIVTAENHNMLTGLGAGVAHVLARKCPVPIEFIGVDDQYGQVGMLDFQKEVYHLRSEDIVEKALTAVSRKGR